METARVDRSGRVTAVAVVRVLGWGRGSVSTSGWCATRWSSRRLRSGCPGSIPGAQVSLPAWRMCGILPGTVGGVGCRAVSGCLVVHPVAALAGCWLGVNDVGEREVVRRRARCQRQD